MDSTGALEISEELIAPDIVVVSARGEIDLYTVPVLRDRLLDVIDRPSELEVILDLSATDFVDATALGTIVAADRRLAARGSRLHLVGARGAVARILAITGLDAALPCHPDHASAQAAMARRPAE